MSVHSLILVASKIGRKPTVFGWYALFAYHSFLAEIMLLVASIHHTGTKLVHDEILKNVHPQSKHRVHIEPKLERELMGYAGFCKIIVPLRHPRIVALGWKKRRKDLWELHDQWWMLKEMIAPLHPYYLPIEHEDRDRILAFIGHMLGLELKTDWPIIKASPAPMKELDDSEERLLASWMEDGFFKTFGYY